MYYCLKKQQQTIYDLKQGSNPPHVYCDDLKQLYVPNIPFNKQQEIINQINNLEVIIKENEFIIKDAENKINGLTFSGYPTKYKLSDNAKFSVSIGKRVLKKNIKNNGKYPIYSANVFKPFGYTDSLLFDEFNTPSVLWGIDGDWMTNYIQENMPFYPTDHCGVLRCIDGSMNTIYLAYALYEVGKEFNFSRQIRASTDRIKDLIISVPDIATQNQIGNTISVCRDIIRKANNEIKHAKDNIDYILNNIMEIE